MLAMWVGLSYAVVGPHKLLVVQEGHEQTSGPKYLTCLTWLSHIMIPNNIEYTMIFSQLN